MQTNTMIARSLGQRVFPLIASSSSRMIPKVTRPAFCRFFSEEPDDLVIDVTDIDTYNTFKSEEKPSVVCFGTKKSDDCRKIAPLFSFFSTKVLEANFLKVDIQESPAIAKAEGITTIPAYKLFKKNELLMDFAGASGVQLMEMIELAQAKKAYPVCQINKRKDVFPLLPVSVTIVN